ncbi:hypothetical protein AKJ52_00885 [candidate division MSBL1 archaeon SCGC-AAA382C18]|uniref:Uncharacterized protein n=1 Tax=candidate division MSBL1 archaeon SCGC-AAA382C18 TaxID=1698281 RepID=A0A133VKZ5_9EURY|nr:hypothetical protein AKJ52_00885 [candidate division MSBL1 archaeon SCGC-AAA382C18]
MNSAKAEFISLFIKRFRGVLNISFPDFIFPSSVLTIWKVKNQLDGNSKKLEFIEGIDYGVYFLIVILILFLLLIAGLGKLGFSYAKSTLFTIGIIGNMGDYFSTKIALKRNHREIMLPTLLVTQIAGKNRGLIFMKALGMFLLMLGLLYSLPLLGILALVYCFFTLWNCFVILSQIRK